MAKTKNITITLGIYYVVLFTVWLAIEWLFHSHIISTSDPVNYWLIQSGIKELIYLSDKYHDTHASIASRRMFNMTGVKYRAYQPTGREIKLDV